MKNIWLIYSGGIPNYGDEMIAQVWVEYIKIKLKGKVTIFLDSPNPAITADFFLNDPSVKVVNVFWKISRAAQGKNRTEKYEWLRNILDNPGDSLTRLSIEFLKENVDVVHFIGGGYLNNIWNNSVTIDFGVLLKKINPNLLLYGTGLGLLPADNAYVNYYKPLYKVFDYIEARDQDSAQVFSVKNSIDDMWLAFSALSEFKPVKKATGYIPKIMLNLQLDFNEEYINEVVDKMIELTKSHTDYQDDMVIGIAEAYPKRDSFLYDRIADRLTNKLQKFSLASLMINGFPANSETFWITTRFHFHLIASALGSKGIALTSGSQYYEIKHKSLIDLGSGWKMINVATNNAYQSKKQDLTNLSVAKLEIANMLYERLNL